MKSMSEILEKADSAMSALISGGGYLSQTQANAFVEKLKLTEQEWAGLFEAMLKITLKLAKKLNMSNEELKMMLHEPIEQVGFSVSDLIIDGKEVFVCQEGE